MTFVVGMFVSGGGEGLGERSVRSGLCNLGCLVSNMNEELEENL